MSLWDAVFFLAFSSSELAPLLPYCGSAPASLSKISLMATSLGHRGKQGAAVWFHPEDAEREELFRRPLAPQTGWSSCPTGTREAEVWPTSRSEGGDRGRGRKQSCRERNKCLPGTPTRGSWRKSFCLRKTREEWFFFKKKKEKLG